MVPLLLLVLHTALGLVLNSTPILSTLHALCALMVGVFMIIRTPVPQGIIVIVAYITGSEVLWRMTDAHVFWEYGKYATGTILLLTMVRHRLVRLPVLPTVYFFLLIPSMIFPLQQLPFEQARQQISFNLSGPFSLAVAVWFFSQVRLSVSDLLKAMEAALLPLVSIAVLALYTTLTAEQLTFTTESNVITSGGFGPNQVSAVLGLGAFLAFVYIMLDGRYRLQAQSLMVVFLAQAALTFSRTGVYLAACSIAAVVVFAWRTRGPRQRAFLSLTAAGLVAALVLYPALDAFTGGALTARFTDTNPTGRDKILQADISIWWNHFLFGVGPGMAKPYRAEYFRAASAHTEFSRLLAEHGVLGVLAFLSLMVLGLHAFLSARGPVARAVVSGLLAWALLFQLVSAMRLVAPSVVLGLACSPLFRQTRQGLGSLVQSTFHESRRKHLRVDGTAGR